MTLPPFYPILDTAILNRSNLPVIDAGEALLDAGARIIQLRHKGYWDRATFGIAKQLAGMCASAGVEFVVNDRCDMALAVGAPTVHIGQDDLPPSCARAIGGSQLQIGFSTHNEAQLRAAAAEPVDYLALGPVFGTSSKATPDPELGIIEWARLRPLSTVSLVAIGGIKLEHANDLRRAGADSLAIISDLFVYGTDASALRRRAEEWLRIS